MTNGIWEGPDLGFINPLGTDPRQYQAINGNSPYTQFWSGSAAVNSYDYGKTEDPGDFTGLTTPGGASSIFAGVGALQSNYHFDFHFKLWVIPTVLRLSNPQLDTNISFYLWNTNDDPETIGSVLVSGSSVLSFDILPGNTIDDFQFRLVNMQIGEGEANIDATVQFVTEELSAILTVLAAVSDTFNLVPDVPVKEIWDFKTDILRNIKGVDQRISLRRYPRLRQEFDVEIIDLRQRREQYDLLRRNIKVQSLVPMYQHATNATAVTPIGGNVIYLDPKRSNLRVNGQVVIINPTTEQAVITKINTLNSDNIVIDSVVGFEITPHWVVIPAINCIIESGSGIEMQNVTGTLRIKADSYTEPTVLRPGATRTIDTFDSLPHLNRRPLIPASEDMEFYRDILDNEIGARDVKSQWLVPKVSGDRKFTIQRVSDPDEMDYWRSLFDTIRGSWKPFLLATWFPDLTQATIAGQATSTLFINEGYYENSYFPFDAYKRIQIEYSNGDITYHKILSSTSEADGTGTISISPGLPDDPAYAGANITTISFLLKVRATDKVVFRHFANYTDVSFGIETTDD